MFKPPKGIKYGTVSKDELEGEMLSDPYLTKLMQRRMEAKAKVDALADRLKGEKAQYKKSFWSLWKAEADLVKAKLRRGEVDSRCKTGWQKRCWELFRILRFRKLKNGKAKKD
jgi:hypothetical protein